ncbi:hypothetical protein I4641_07175 [Waterburya agarophytonicola K14]|uniref:Uncharacterized protein n=1 Tax=Waterburya agarophytonicola KI4 TaxID=2874699 RepID=A0A964FGQ6_9CYAN|nr:hypothetical protein [Waterburya agarophytonicola]MCC0176758.1 hypothetical protein [Waterburya agarophytonicola KI4]
MVKGLAVLFNTVSTKLGLMISRFNWFLGTLFLMAAFGALMNPPPYIAIAILFFLIGFVLLPPTDKLTRKYFQWKIKGGTKGTLVLMSLIIICLIVPQVETNPGKFSQVQLYEAN